MRLAIGVVELAEGGLRVLDGGDVPRLGNPSGDVGKTKEQLRAIRLAKGVCDNVQCARGWLMATGWRPRKYRFDDRGTPEPEEDDEPEAEEARDARPRRGRR